MKNPLARLGSSQSYFLKLLELVLALMAVFLAFNFFFLIVSSIQGLRWMLPAWYMLFVRNVYVFVFPALFLIGCPLSAYFWQRKEVAGGMNPERSHAVIRGVIRWGLAFALIFFSIVFFAFPMVSRWSRLLVDDMTTSTVSGNYLFEYLLLRSQTFRGFLSGSLMLGSFLLFFKRTTFAGLVIAMFTSLLLLFLWLTVGSFSEFNGGYIIGGYVLVATGYLIMLQWNGLRSKLMGTGQMIPPVASMRFRWAMLLLVVASVGLVYKQSIHEMYKNKQLVGKWKVKVLERNGAALPTEAWMTDDAAWTTVYIDAKDELRFCSNPYKFDQGASFYSRYQLDAEKGQLSIAGLRNVGGPIQFQVEGLGTNELSWRGKVGPDEVRMVLARDL
jgi:hypothetical protein